MGASLGWTSIKSRLSAPQLANSFSSCREVLVHAVTQDTLVMGKLLIAKAVNATHLMILDKPDCDVNENELRKDTPTRPGLVTRSLFEGFLSLEGTRSHPNLNSLSLKCLHLRNCETTSYEWCHSRV